MDKSEVTWIKRELGYTGMDINSNSMDKKYLKWIKKDLEHRERYKILKFMDKGDLKHREG